MRIKKLFKNYNKYTRNQHINNWVFGSYRVTWKTTEVQDWAVWRFFHELEKCYAEMGQFIIGLEKKVEQLTEENTKLKSAYKAEY